MAETYSSIIYRPSMTLLTHDGALLGGPFGAFGNLRLQTCPSPSPEVDHSTVQLCHILGVSLVRFDKRVVDYGESNKTNHAYAMTDNGQRFDADVVVAADGIGTKVGKAIAGKEAKAMNSGYSVYRVSYPTGLLQKDSLLARQYSFQKGEPDYCEVYIGPNGNMIILVSPELTTWLFTHKVRLLRLLFM